MTTVATLPQTKHLIEIFESLGSSELQRLYASGLLTDIVRFARSHDPIGLDRNSFQSMLGIDPFTFRVQMGDGRNTNQITATLGCPFDSRITQANFPLQQEVVPWEDSLKIVDPNSGFNEEQGLRLLAGERLSRPNYEHGIRFAGQFCDATISKKKRLVVFLHTSWNGPDGYRHVMVFDRHPQIQRLALYRLSGPFDHNSVLAGVVPPA